MGSEPRCSSAKRALQGERSRRRQRSALIQIAPKEFCRSLWNLNNEEHRRNQHSAGRRTGFREFSIRKERKQTSRRSLSIAARQGRRDRLAPLMRSASAAFAAGAFAITSARWGARSSRDIPRLSGGWGDRGAGPIGGAPRGRPGSSQNPAFWFRRISWRCRASHLTNNFERQSTEDT